MKSLRPRWLLITLIVILAVVFVGVVWSVWPTTPKDLTLHLKFVRTEVVDGKTKLLFRVEGAEKCDIHVLSFRYIRGDDPLPLQHRYYSVFINSKIAREFYADHPKYSLFNYEGCKLQADVSLQDQESKFSKLRRVIQETWKYRKQLGLTFSAAKLNWQMTPQQLTTEQTITSDVITNLPPN